MTQTFKTTRLLTYTLLLLAGFAASAFSDSFVNDEVVRSLSDFTYGQTLSTEAAMENTLADSETGDSFVNGAAMAALEGFRFGFAGDFDFTADVKNTDTAELWFHPTDSFVDIHALNYFGQATDSELVLLD